MALSNQLNKLGEMKEHYFVSSDCPITPGAEEVEVYFDVTKDRLFFHCWGCGCTWLENPEISDMDFYLLEEVTSDCVRLPTIDELKIHGIENPKIVYEKINPDIRVKIQNNTTK